MPMPELRPRVAGGAFHRKRNAGFAVHADAQTNLLLAVWDTPGRIYFEEPAEALAIDKLALASGGAENSADDTAGCAGWPLEHFCFRCRPGNCSQRGHSIEE